jgi:hypothetical protein
MGGITGDGTPQNCVAINSSLQKGGNGYIGRIWSSQHPDNTGSNNFARGDMFINAATNDTTTTTSGAITFNGKTIRLDDIDTESEWKSVTGWASRFGSSESAPWKWDSTNKTPRMYWETTPLSAFLGPNTGIDIRGCGSIEDPYLAYTEDGITLALTNSYPSLELANDINVTSGISLSGFQSLSLSSADGGPYSMIRDNAFTGSFFDLEGNAFLTLTDVTLDGGGDPTSASGALINTGSATGVIITLGSGVVLKDNYKQSGAGAGIWLAMSCTLNMTDNAQITGCGNVKGAGIAAVNGSTINMSGGVYLDSTSDILLGNGTKITVLGALTHATPVAILTPGDSSPSIPTPSYSGNPQLVEVGGSYTDLAAASTMFAVTPDGVITYKVDANGQLAVRPYGTP